MYGYACAYSPDLSSPGAALLPFDPATGADRGRRARGSSTTRCAWPPRTPTRCAACAASTWTPGGDEFYLDLGAQAFAQELSKIGAAHTLELFDGKHGGITYRYPGAIRELVTALQA